MYRLVLVFYFLFLSITHAQDAFTSKEVEEQTYKYYLQKDWKNVIHTGHAALKKDIDYFYLRMRMGIAYYEQEKYLHAIKHFEKALTFNSADTLAQEYAYYCYYFCGRNAESKLFLAKMLPEMRKKMLKKNSPIDHIAFEAANMIVSDSLKNYGIDIDGQGNAYGEQDITKSIRYFNVSLQHNFAKRFTYLHNISYVDVNKIKQIKYNNVLNARNYDQIQIQYYGSLSIFLGKGITFTPAMHFLQLKNHNITATQTGVTYRFDPQAKRNIPHFSYLIGDTISTTTNFLISGMISKFAGPFKLDFSGSYSELNGGYQSQGGAALTWFPKGNYNVYTNISMQFYLEKGAKQKPIISFASGAKLTRIVFAEVFGSVGYMSNYNEQNGLVLYNVSDVIKSKIGGTLKFSLTKNVDLAFSYINMQREKYYNTYVLGAPVNNLPTFKSEYLPTKYSNEMLLLQLKIKIN